ncbi:uncharacterized protein LOC144657969 [Oculina patagonica]
MTEECRILKFKATIEGYSLQGHVFNNLTVKRESACDARCFIEHNCVSFNVGASHVDGGYICELSDSDHEMHPEALVRRNGFTYRPTENACLKSPCHPDLLCQNGFTDKGYRCISNTQKPQESPSSTPSQPESTPLPNDIDECTENTDDCSSNADCSNLVGSFECTCRPGFNGDGKTCQDINECSIAATNNCDQSADCTNTDGSFQCTCRDGYSGDGTACQDIDECTANTHDCSPDADCSNDVGSFQCTCRPGFTGDGKTCQDIDECTLNSHDCSSDADCSNDVGSFQCTCNPGFIGDGKTCQALVQCQSPWIAFQGSCYAQFTQARRWSDADTHCKSESAQLVKIESADENEFIRQNFLLIGGDYWIGLTDAETEGVWKWSDGSQLTGYTHWDSNEPTGLNWENCVAIRNTGAQWYDRSCTDWKGCICKK